MLKVHCFTDSRRLVSSTINGAEWFEQASEEDILDFLDDGWQGNAGSHIAAYDFLEFYKDGPLKSLNEHLERESKHEINVLMDIDPEHGLAWFEHNRPDVFDVIVSRDHSDRHALTR